ncbi:MAG: hypothetical protein KDA37_11460 [Planctomycetales bacterium]|nr:hypothetical protein [Planctomycetales bacterium]
MKSLFFTLVMLFFTSACSAAIFLRTERTPTVGIPNTSTWTITLVSDDPNEIIFGVSAKITGTLGQVRGGPITTTPFQDMNGFFDFIGADVSQDSQFLFLASELSPPALSVVDTENELSAAITNLPSATGGDGLIVPLAQVVLQNCPIDVEYLFALDIRDPSGQNVGAPVLAGGRPLYCVPEPAAVGMTAYGSLILAGLRFRRGN